MRKDSSNSRGDSRGAGKKFSGSSGSKPFNKEGKSFKKNYDGRSAGAGDSGRGDKPYSGRSKDGDSAGKPSWKRESAGRTERPERRDNDSRTGRPEGNNRTEKPSWKRESAGRTERPERRTDDKRGGRSFDKDKRTEGRPFDKDRTEKPSWKRESAGKSERPERRTDDRKPPREFDKDKRSNSRPFSNDRSEKPSWKRDSSGPGESGKGGSESRPPRDFDKTRKPGSKPFENKRRPFGETGDRKERPFDKERGAGEGRKPRAASDSRPFRDRPKPFSDRKSADDNEGKVEKEVPAFDKVLKNAFNPAKKKKGEEPGDPITPVIHEDKIFGELADPVVEDKPKRFSLAKKEGTDKRKVTSAFTKKKFIHDHSEGRKKKYKDDEDEDDEDGADGKPEQMPLNKYIAHSGECSRRDAAELVKQGKVKVNGELILDPGYKVKDDDLVTLVGKKLKPTKDNAYILLNKPKGYITTNEDPQGRKTVMELLSNAGIERLFPVGRLDRDTSGLLLITNDGDLTQKLCHPSFNVKKVYHVTLDKPLTKADFEKIVEGVELEDGKAIVDEIAYLEVKNEIGLEIHSGKNRIVRRIFESLGYVVEKLDRMMYAGLTKKNLPRGKWRHLDPREVVLLKHFKS